MSRVAITTTPTFSNGEITKYNGIVTAHIVIGVNLFADAVASLSDIFGGNSETYQNKLALIYQQIISDLELKTLHKNANALVGLHIDFEEITGKGKQMFMATAIGTACVVDFKNDGTALSQAKVIGYSEIERKFKVRKITKTLESKDEHINEKTWNYILANQLPEIATLLTKRICEPNIYYNENFSKYEQYISSISYEHAVEAIYPYISQRPTLLLRIIRDHNLFSAKQILQLIEKGEINLAINLLQAPKEYYDNDDLVQMEQIIEKLEHLPDLGHFETATQGIFSKSEKQVYICPDGHQNDVDCKFCNTAGCGKNIKGLTCTDLEVIEDFKLKVESLRDLFQERNK